MKAVVTGGAGFIGSTLVDRLLLDGHDVVAIDNLATGGLGNLEAAKGHGDRFTFAEADICDRGVVDLIAAARPEVVFHLAAQADVRVSVADTYHDVLVNVVGSINVADGCRRGGARKVVFASSGGTIYGEPASEALPVPETHPREPVSPYGVAKSVVIDYLRAYESLHGLRHTALALSNVYGPRQDPHGEAGVVAIFTGRLLGGEPCTVFGTGDQTRDFVYVDDVVDAFVRAADRADGLVVNIGTGEETTVNHLYEVMAAAAGVHAPAVRAPARPGELDRNVLDISRARAELGWSPRVKLDEGLANVIEWFRQRG